MYKRLLAHNGSIIDLTYMPKAQLIVSTSTDQTIRVFAPVARSYELSDPKNIPHAQFRPGYYQPLKSEKTKTNDTFKEVKRIYCGNDSVCYALRCLNISNIILDSNNPQFKS